MGALLILAEMRDLIRLQTEQVVAGNHQAVVEAVARHEQLLSALETAEVDGTPDEIMALVAEIDREKAKLQSLLSYENNKVDFLLRLILGGGATKAGGYPTGAWRQEGPSRKLNRRT